MDDITKAVERAIDTMHHNLGDKLTIDDLARSAMFSKFHFTRVFQRVTGVSPGRFLSALRLEQAKHLLLTTSVTVADIGHQVGYNSIGTFSTRFRASVGVSPITYRQLGGIATRIPQHHTPAAGSTTVRGHVRTIRATTLDGIFIGLFPTRVPECAPARHAVLRAPGPYQLQNAPAGTWYLTAHATAAEPEAVRYVGCYGPFTTRPDSTARLADLHLRPAGRTDPPLLLALPDLTEHAELDLAG